MDQAVVTTLFEEVDQLVTPAMLKAAKAVAQAVRKRNEAGVTTPDEIFLGALYLAMCQARQRASN